MPCQMTQRSSHTLLAFVSNVALQTSTADFISFPDKSIQSAGAAGVWRADAMKVPYVAQAGAKLCG